jgi:hypothetical protein
MVTGPVVSAAKMLFKVVTIVGGSCLGRSEPVSIGAQLYRFAEKWIVESTISTKSATYSQGKN